MANRKFKISTTYLIAWIERLSMLLRSGVSLAEALTLIGTGASGKRKIDKRISAMSVSFSDMVLRGNSFSSALESWDMPQILVSLVRVGESTGSLSEVLQHASEYFRTKEDTRHKIIGAATYPVLIGFATCGVAGFLVGFIFPKIVPLFTSMNIVLPLPTRVLLSTSQFFGSYWILILCAAIFMTGLLIFIYKMFRPVRRLTEIILLRLPILGEVHRCHVHVRVFQIIFIQLEHGTSLPHALTEVAEAERSVLFSQAFSYSAEDVSRGGTFSASMRMYANLFSSDTVGLIGIAERTGEVSKVCRFISDNAKIEIDRTIAVVSRFIEPVLMLGMGLIVGSIALSIIMPIYEITNKINAH